MLAAAIKEMMINETITVAPKDCDDSGAIWETGTCPCSFIPFISVIVFASAAVVVVNFHHTVLKTVYVYVYFLDLAVMLLTRYLSNPIYSFRFCVIIAVAMQYSVMKGILKLWNFIAWVYS